MVSNPTIVRFGGYQSPRFGPYQGRPSVRRAPEPRPSARPSQFELTGNVIDLGRPARDLLAMVETGELDLCYFSASYLAERVPEMALLDLPFTFSDRAKVYSLLDGPLGDYLAGRIEAATGYRLLGFWDNGFRHFSNSVHPIRQPEDCRGLRIRTLFSDAHQEVFRALGFDPVALDVKDLLSGIEEGTVVAQENPLTNIFNFDIHLKHRYITLSAHFFGAAVLLCNAESLEQWPETGTRRGPGLRGGGDGRAAPARRRRRRRDSPEAQRQGRCRNRRTRRTPGGKRFADAVQPLIEAQRARFGDTLFRLLA